MELTLIGIIISNAGIRNLWSFTSTPPVGLYGVYFGTTVLLPVPYTYKLPVYKVN
jgi:hypothetical protein